MSPALSARSRAPALNTRPLWLLAAGLVALHQVAVAWIHHSIGLGAVCALVWGGAWICLEDRLPEAGPQPSWPGLALGGALLAFGLWRSFQIFHPDAVVYALPLVLGPALALLYAPLRELRPFRDALLVLALMPATLLASRVIPVDELSHLTARLTQGVLLLTGELARVDGREVWLAGGGVRIAGSCSGVEILLQVTAIATIFVLAFPLRSAGTRLLMVLVAAPAAAILANAVRIALLTVIVSSDWADKQRWFDFFHEDEGSLVFAALTVSGFAWLYLRRLDRELKAAEAQRG